MMHRPGVRQWHLWPKMTRGLPTSMYALFVLLPIVALLARAASTDGIGANLWSSAVLEALTLSLITSTLAMGIVVMIGTPMAYTLSRGRIRYRGLVELLIQVPLVLPPVVVGLGMLMAFGHQGLIGGWLQEMGVYLPFTTGAVVMCQVFVAAPFYIRTALTGFDQVDPTYEEVAQTLGRGPWATFWQVSLPMARTSLLAGLALAWARALSEFGATIMFAGNFPGRTRTMPLAILGALEEAVGDALALSILLLAFALVILALLTWGMTRKEGER